MHYYYIIDRRARDANQLGWEENHAILVVAKNELEARELAANDAGEEGPKPWLDNKRSLAKEIGPADTPSRIMMRQRAS